MAFRSVSTVMMSRLVLNLHEAAARTAHESHAMRVVGNAHTGVNEELELHVFETVNEPMSTDSGGSGPSGCMSRSLRRLWHEHAAGCA
jgi:hypothetical protein